MRQAEGASWQMDVRRGDLLCDVALWVRAVERIDVPADPIVPGPLDADQLPSPTGDWPRSVGAAWLEWWRTVVRVSVPEALRGYSTPDLPGLALWADLRDVVVPRWKQAAEWHRTRARGARRADSHRPPREINTNTVRDVERSLSRKVAPFSIRFILLPVRDSTVRQVADDRFLVPEHLYDGPEWPERLADLVRRIG